MYTIRICLFVFLGSQKLTFKEPMKEKTDTKPMQSYLVPTPFVLASSSPYSLPSAKPSVPPDKSSQPHMTPSNKEPNPKNNLKPVAPQAFSEVNGVLPSATKPRDFSVRIPEGPLPRGPLSYEALVHLRRSASTKKTPLCPLIDHTLEMDKHLPVTAESPNIQNLPRPDRSHSDAVMPKRAPPAVAPKPKRIPASISDKAQTTATIPPDTIKHATDPQLVRLEALQKLGLLKEQQPNAEQVAPRTLLRPNPPSDPTPNRFTRGTSNINPSRSPSFCYSQVHSQPKSKPLQTSASFHHDSRYDQQPVSMSHRTQPSGLQAAGLEPSVLLDNHSKNGNCIPTTTPAAAQPIAHNPSNIVPYTVMVVPGMGADRKEALRKLGLLKV